jgi:hypothetical protein
MVMSSWGSESRGKPRTDEVAALGQVVVHQAQNGGALRWQRGVGKLEREMC